MGHIGELPDFPLTAAFPFGYWKVARSGCAQSAKMFSLNCTDRRWVSEAQVGLQLNAN
jgi:hypothetical protein